MTKLKTLRVGTAKAVEELAALAGRSVGEVTGDVGRGSRGGLLVGTEAVLHRVGRADLVAFVDFDAELSAPQSAPARPRWRSWRGRRASRAVVGRRAGARADAPA